MSRMLFFLLFLLLFCWSLIYTACGDDNDEDDPGEADNDTPEDDDDAVDDDDAADDDYDDPPTCEELYQACLDAASAAFDACEAGCGTRGTCPWKICDNHCWADAMTAYAACSQQYECSTEYEYQVCMAGCYNVLATCFENTDCDPDCTDDYLHCWDGC